MKLLVLCLFTSLLASSAGAAEGYSLKLNKSDSVMFDQLLTGFSGPKKVVDPEHPSVFYSKRWYQSQNQAVTIACRATTVDGEFFSTHCDFEFLPSNSSAEVMVEKRPGGVVRATINDPVAATQMYKNLELNPFYSNETVELNLDGGREEVSRVYAECFPVMIMSTDAKNCVIEFIPD